MNHRNILKFKIRRGAKLSILRRFFSGLLLISLSYLSQSTECLAVGNLAQIFAQYRPSCSDAIRIASANQATNCHNIDYCQAIDSSTALDRIGNNCLIRLPIDCTQLPLGMNPSPGTNCLNLFGSSGIYKTATAQNPGKYLAPTICSDSSQHGISCIKSDLPYCQEESSPILGVNCRLSPCTAISNTNLRRPGVNCLADCNDSSDNFIKEPQYFFEGLNCLKNCATTANPIAGENCTYDFQGYTTPMCRAKLGGGNSELFLANRGGNNLNRKNCVDLIDLPFCNHFLSSPGRGTAGRQNINCVNHCTSTTDVSNENCVAFEGEAGYGNILAKKYCHRNLGYVAASSASCEKLSCDLLTPEELFATQTSMLGNGNNWQNQPQNSYCDSSSIRCNQLNKAQLDNSVIGLHCTPIQCNCVSGGDISDVAIVKNLDLFYGSSNYSTAYNGACNRLPGVAGNNQNYLSTPCCSGGGSCPPQNATQIFQCQSTTVKHQDCDNQADQSCPSGTCTRTGIDCRDQANFNRYSICNPTSVVRATDDPFVSWFFRPYPLSKSMKDFTTNGFTRKIPNRMSGYPINGQGTQNDDIHYTIEDMKTNGFGSTLFFGLLSHSYLSPDDTRSPGPSGGTDNPSGVAGYQRICGMTTKPNGTPRDDFGYFKGNVESTYTDNSERHSVTLCVRSMNINVTVNEYSPLSTCGARECGISAAFNDWTGKACGTDICQTVVVEGGDDYNKCAMSDDEYEESNTNRGFKPCKERLGTGGDNNIKIRAYKLDKNDSYICAALDVYDISGSGHYSGNEIFELEDGKRACVSGTLDANNSCTNGYDTSGNDTTRWHTVKHFKFIGNVPDYYINSSALEYKVPELGIIARESYSTPKFFKKSDCIRHPLRVGAPTSRNVTNSQKSPGLVTPSLYIIKSCAIKDTTRCTNSLIQDAPTDFYEPMIEVGYGIDASLEPLATSQRHKLISIDFDKNISTPPSGQTYEKLTTSMSGITYETEIYLKKEDGTIPQVCLYRKIKVDGDYSASDQLVGCIQRNKPNFNNYEDEGGPLRKLLISNIALSSYDKFSLDAQYLYSTDSSLVGTSKKNLRDNANCQTSNARCSTATTVNLRSDVLQSGFDIGNERFSISFGRDECTKLNFECIANQITINQKVRNNSINISQAENNPIKLYCDGMMKLCNNKKGITTLDLNPSKIIGFNQKAYGNYYGWFNEICVTSGFDEKLNRNVIALVPINKNGGRDEGKMGKCVIDGIKKSIIDAAAIRSGRSVVDCSDGGKEPDCPCLTEGARNIDNNIEIIREITPHEAGLCIEIPTLRSCPAIKYPINDDSSNLYFTSLDDLNRDYSVATNNLAVIAHRARSLNSFTDIENPANIYANGHIEFGFALAGESSVYGKCNGFWKMSQNLGSEINPLADCDSSGIWKNFRNGCIRYSCPLMTTFSYGSNQEGIYPGYDVSGNDAQLGMLQGFANWQKFIKTNDNKELVTARSCLIGYKTATATRITNNNSPTDSDLSTMMNGSDNVAKAIQAAFKQTSSYNNTDLPTRHCNQLGSWETPISSCQRIQCVATKKFYDISAGLQDSTIQEFWRSVNGILVNSDAPAARSSLPQITLPSSIAEGTCMEGLGFFALSSTQLPKLYCDHNGNWSRSINPCQVNCDAIDANVGRDVGHGFATWLGYIASFSNQMPIKIASNCINGYYPYPYPPRFDYEGELGTSDEGATAISLTSSSNALNETIYQYPAQLTIKIKATIPASEANQSTNVKLSDGTKTISVKKIYQISGQSILRNPWIGELEAGKTYIFEKRSVQNVEVWIMSMAYAKNLTNDPRYYNLSTNSVIYSPSSPVRSCNSRSSNVGGVTRFFNTWTAPDTVCVNKCVGGKDANLDFYDPRIGAGITEHDVSNNTSRTGKILVKWDTENFGIWQVKQFEGAEPATTGSNAIYAHEQSGSQNASDYISGRTNKKFALARKCNDITHKWEEPIALCAANNGVVDARHNATVAVTAHVVGIGEFLKLGQQVNASCLVSSNNVSNFEYDFTRNTNGTYTINTLQYSCENNPTNDNIDEIYYRTSGNPCIQTCPSYSGAVYGNGIDNATYDQNQPFSKKYKNGESLSLKCKSGYGNKVAGGDRIIANGEDVTQLCKAIAGTNTTRTATSPSVSCNNGSWNTNITNNCDACRSCDASSKVKGFIIDVRGGGSGNDDGRPVSIAAGSDFSTADDYFSVKISCDGDQSCNNNNDKYKVTTLTNKENACHVDNNCVSEDFLITFKSDGENGNNNKIYVNPTMNHDGEGSTSGVTQGRLSNNNCSNNGVFRGTDVSGTANAKCVDGSFVVGLYCWKGTNAHHPIVEVRAADASKAQSCKALANCSCLVPNNVHGTDIIPSGSSQGVRNCNTINDDFVGNYIGLVTYSCNNGVATEGDNNCEYDMIGYH